MKGLTGRLALIAAGGGCLVLLLFVALPWLTEAPPPPEEAPVPSMSGNEGSGVEDEPEGPQVIGVRNTGEEVAVVFRAAEEAAPEGETIASGEGAGADDEREVPTDAAESLPPVLSPQEVAAAMDGLDAGVEDPAVPPGGRGGERSAAQGGSAAAEETRMEQAERWLAKAMRRGDSLGIRPVQVMLPPLSATRDVQELLEALGYEPGHVDGIWGERTEAAWRRFARDAMNRDGGTEPVEARGERAAAEPENVGEHSVAESPAPSRGSAETDGPSTGQAGDGRRQAGPPPEAVPEAKEGPRPELNPEPEVVAEAERVPQPVVVPGTLRGVMGYRMPLVSRQGVPDQVVSGVLIPAHTTFVIVRPGYWELVGLEAGEVERLREPATPDVELVKRGWNPFRLFRKRGLPAEGNGP